MLDVHCHIAYGSDDGAESIGVALSMIELAAECGTKGIAVTPHANIPGGYRNYFNEGIAEKLKALRQAAEKLGYKVKLFSGQEIFLTDNVLPLLESGKLVTLNGTKYPLVEFDFDERQNSAISKLERLTSAGFIPVVAHPERYGFVIEDMDAVTRMRDMGCVLQVNKGSIDGFFGEVPFRVAHRMLRRQLADIVASDAHSPYMRTPDMRKAHEIVCNDVSFEYADLLFTKNPAKILQNREIIRY